LNRTPFIERTSLRPAIVLAALVVLALVAPPSSHALGASVTTLAGSAGVAGSADGTGATARFGGPYALACDPAGDLYVADSDNGTLRKVTAAGVVSTVIGAAAGLSYPQGVACDALGTVYVADTYHHVIRKVLPGGALGTVAGLEGEQGAEDGTGTAARFSYPAGLACDGSGSIYVADVGNGVVRKVTPAGQVTTVVGPDAGLESPQSVACGSDGSLYVTDTGGSRLLRLAGGSLVEIVGAASLSYPGGVACDAAGTVYVADTDNDCIRRCEGAGSAVVVAGAVDAPGSTDGPGPEARFSGPQGVACDAAGNVYVADTGNHTVRKVSIDGRPPVTTVSPALAGDPTSGWRTAAVTLTLSAVDAGSGVVATYYSLDDGEPVLYTVPFAVAASGSHRVTYHSVDGSGNDETPRSGYVNIDVVDPVTTAEPALAPGPAAGWVATAATVALSAADDLSGVSATRYSVDGGPEVAYSAPFMVAGGGSHTVVYASVDVAGNQETRHVAYVNIDDAPPVTTAAPALSSSRTTGWRNTPLTVTLKATDEGAGVAGTSYSVDGAPPEAYSTPFTVSGAGSHLVAWSSVDALGAVEATRTGYVNIDTSLPRTTATAATAKPGKTVDLRYRVDDAEPTCGGAALTLQVRRDGKTVRTVDLGTVRVNAALTCRFKATLPKGAYTWRVQGADIAGNRAGQVTAAKLTVR
jgi:sugar lactone lactonase YvrE